MKFQALFALALLFAYAPQLPAQCGPNGCGVSAGRGLRSMSYAPAQSYQPTYSYSYAAPSGGCSGGTTAYYQPTVTYPAYGQPTYQAAPAVAPAPPMPQATSDPMVLASDGHWYPLSAWSRPATGIQQPTPAYVAAVGQVYAGPIYSAYVVEARTPMVPVAAVPVYAGGSVYRERVVIRSR